VHRERAAAVWARPIHRHGVPVDGAADRPLDPASSLACDEPDRRTVVVTQRHARPLVTAEPAEQPLGGAHRAAVAHGEVPPGGVGLVAGGEHAEGEPDRVAGDRTAQRLDCVPLDLGRDLVGERAQCDLDRAARVDDVQPQRHRALAELSRLPVRARQVAAPLADVVAVQALVPRAAVLVGLGHEVLRVLQQ
jgi:hypothetical protein